MDFNTEWVNIQNENLTRINVWNIIDFSNFPKEFINEEDALSTYNKLGLPLKIQFKKLNRKCFKNSSKVKFFTIWWINRIIHQWNLNKGIKLKVKSLSCPVSVRFVFKEESWMYHRRTNQMIHNHDLKITPKYLH